MRLRTSTSIIDMVPQARESYDPQIELDGTHVYKATIVKSLFSSNPMSKDRLRRVRGMTKFTGEQSEADMSIESSIMVGDPLLIDTKGTLRVSKVIKLMKAGR